VKIEFDPSKDAINRQKHGLSLQDAARLDIETAAVIPDDRYPYGEARFRAYGWIDGRLHMLAHHARRRFASDFIPKSKCEGGKALWPKDLSHL
jgi:uncharacterized DUF497 family protein